MFMSGQSLLHLSMVAGAVEASSVQRLILGCFPILLHPGSPQEQSPSEVGLWSGTMGQPRRVYFFASSVTPKVFISGKGNTPNGFAKNQGDDIMPHH